ncbi:hypothetical protein MUN82_03990 [Hymenobacter aerilatus]|uniref:Uncharacterized protein n=1 Tax=Hymenobacter aerilatus TaxID=2932251 RepID=A0A8T9T144_9BACT|nr:hypothetical protein [Hymenobacter aerilatus]UOR06260.1 hypothetical protein MUN82_03990 [Hymenobacter aerilatus]
MKTPQQYIDQVMGNVPSGLLTNAAAQAAIAQAQADLHAYYRQLMRAVRNSRPSSTRGLALPNEEAA